MDGNDTPRSLDEELDHEATGGEPAFSSRQNPGRDQKGAHQSGADLQQSACILKEWLMIRTIVLLRPTHWLKYPKIVPPTQAPIFIRILATEAPVLLRPFWSIIIVVYESWLVCE